MTSAGTGIAAIICSKMTRCSATSAPRSSGASRSSWSRASRWVLAHCCLFGFADQGFGSPSSCSVRYFGRVRFPWSGECDCLGDERAGGGIVERRRSLGSVRDRNADLLGEPLLALREIADEAGVGIGTLYRHYPTRPALFAALTLRFFQLLLQHARAAALSDESAPAAHEQLFERTIAARNELILPLHRGSVIDNGKIVALQTEIRNLLEQVLSWTPRPDHPTRRQPDRHHHHRSDARPSTPARS